jgi:hypothetical protein
MHSSSPPCVLHALRVENTQKRKEKEERSFSDVGFEILTAVAMKSFIVWNRTTRRHIPEDYTFHNCVTFHVWEIDKAQ